MKLKKEIISMSAICISMFCLSANAAFVSVLPKSKSVDTGIKNYVYSSSLNQEDTNNACINRDELISMLFAHQDVTNVNTSCITDFSYLLEGGLEDFNQDISNWDVSNGTNFAGMFSSTTQFNQDISGWNMVNGENFTGMFSGALAFNQDISGWNTINAKYYTNFNFNSALEDSNVPLDFQ